jgi:hypothetical protein
VEQLEDRCLLSDLRLRLNAVEIHDNGPGDSSPTAGVITFTGSVPPFIYVSATAISELIGDALKARIFVSEIVVGGPGTLVTKATDIDYKLASQPGPHVLTSLIGGVTGGTVKFINELDPSNTAFADGSPGDIITTGMQGPFGPGAFSDTKTKGFELASADPFSLTDTVTVVHSKFAVTSLGAESNVMGVFLDNPV